MIDIERVRADTPAASRLAYLHNADAIVRSAAGAGITIGASYPSSTRIDAEARALPPLVRASPHYYNTEAEIDRLIAHLASLTQR